MPRRPPHRNIALALAASVLLGACAGDKVFVTASREGSARFDEYLDYRWLAPVEGRRAARTDRHAELTGMVAAAVDRELSYKGFRRRDAGPVDFLVTVDADFEDVAIISSARYRGWGHGYNHFRVPSTRNVSHIDRAPQAMLGARIVDARTDRVVWQASAAGIVPDGDGRERRLREVVERLLADFPPPH